MAVSSCNSRRHAFSIDSFTLINVVDTLKVGLEKTGFTSTSKVVYGPDRPGDIKHSLANIGSIEANLGYKPFYWKWLKQRYSSSHSTETKSEKTVSSNFRYKNFFDKSYYEIYILVLGRVF